MKKHSMQSVLAPLAAMLALGLAAPGVEAAPADQGEASRADRASSVTPQAGVNEKKTIGLVLTSWRPALRETPGGKEECPAGLQFTNVDNVHKQFATPAARAEFDREYVHLGPEASSGDLVNPEQYLLLRGPGGIHVGYNPTAVVDPLPLRVVQSKLSFGLNLDGTTDGRATPKSCKHEKFVSPEGQAGIDNQLYRIMGCTTGWRNSGALVEYTRREFRDEPLDRVLIEISNVEDERNSDDVVVTVYKGIDAIPVDGGDKPIPWLTQRIDVRYPQFVTQAHGRIVNGVLETEPVDQHFALYELEGEAERFLRGMRIQLNLNDTAATGLVAGYEDLAVWWNNFSKAFSTLSNEEGLWSPPAFYAAARQLADGYPDPQTGQCSA